MKTFHLLISGKVQGVFFRASAKKVADQYQLKGWIKNTEEGHVEVAITGEYSAVNAFISWCHSGPKGALVADVVVREDDFLEFKYFEIQR